MALHLTRSRGDHLGRAGNPPLGASVARQAAAGGYDMTSDIALAVGDGTRRMTYAELAAARGISVAAARRLTQRHRWGRHTGNDGFVRVSVPLTALGKARKAVALDAYDTS